MYIRMCIRLECCNKLKTCISERWLSVAYCGYIFYSIQCIIEIHSIISYELMCIMYIA